MHRRSPLRDPGRNPLRIPSELRQGAAAALLLSPLIALAAAASCAATGEAPTEATAAAGGGGGTGGGGLGEFDGGTGEPASDAACVSVTSEAMLTKRPVDVVLIVDNSGSMGDDILAVQSNINASLAAILDQSAVDYRVIVLSLHGWSDTAEAICIKSPLSTASCAPAPALPGINPPIFFHYSTEIASSDSWCKLLDTFDGGLQDDFDLAPKGWSAWLRDEAFKVFVEISDDRVLCGPYDDLGTLAGGVAAAAAFDADLLALSPKSFGDVAQRKYVWHSIGGVSPNAPASSPWLPNDPIKLGVCGTGQNAGTGYQALSILTGGLRFPICEHPSYDAVFEAIATSAIEGANVACEFPVPPAPGGQTIDLGTVVVEYTPGDGGLMQTFKSVANYGACEAGSFYIKDESVIKLCPESCATVQGDGKAKLLVRFDCSKIPT